MHSCIISFVIISLYISYLSSITHVIQSVHHTIVAAISFRLAAPHAARIAYIIINSKIISFNTSNTVIIIVFRSFHRSGRTVSASHLSSSSCGGHRYHHPLSVCLFGHRGHHRCPCRFCMFYFPFSHSNLF